MFWREKPLFFFVIVALNIFTSAFKLLFKLIVILTTDLLAMAEANTTKKSSQTVCNRKAINANWQLLQSSSALKSDLEKRPHPKQNDRFTGTFRKNRKKNNGTSDTLEHNIDEKECENNMVLLSNQDTLKSRMGPSGKLTKVLAMDCEMVGVGMNGTDNMVARVSIVNRFGDCVYDKFVKAREEVTDYRTKVSGVHREDLLNGEEFSVVQREVSEMLKGRILVGHSVKNDLEVLFLSHPRKSTRDTSKYKPFKKITNGSTPSLKRLTAELLGAEIQKGEHSSVVDARATMMLYCRVANEWERTANGPRTRHANTGVSRQLNN